MLSGGNHLRLLLEASLNQIQPSPGLACIAHKDHSSRLCWLIASTFHCFILFLINGNFVRRITKNEIEAIPLLIKMQLSTVVTLRCVHQHKRHRKGLKMHAHKGGGTCQQPWHRRTKIHNTVRQAKNRPPYPCRHRGKLRMLRCNPSPLMV